MRVFFSNLAIRRDLAQREAERLVYNPRGITRSEEARVRELLSEIDRLDARLDAADHIRARVVSRRPPTGAAAADQIVAEQPVKITERSRRLMSARANYLENVHPGNPDVLKEIYGIRRQLAHPDV